MTLEWFRTHKKFVYWIITPVIVISFVFVFGTQSAERQHLGALGPSLQITVNEDKKVVIPSAEVITLRTILWHFTQAQEIATDQAAAHLAKVMNAQALGFEAGEKEMEQQMIHVVKQQVNQRGNSADDIKATKEVYGKLLQNMQLSSSQFERLVHDLTVSDKYDYACKMPMINDGKVFTEFCREKEVVRLRFKTLKSEDFLAQATEAAADKIKDFYDKNKGADEREVYGSMLLTEPKLSADVLHLNTDKLFAEIKAADEELKRYYDQYKPIFWRKDAPKAGDPPLPAGEEFKPMDAVKAEVEEKWSGDQKRSRAQTRMTVLKTEFEQAEKAHKEEQAKLKEAERKPFDMAAWAKTRELTHWTTPEQVEDAYKNGKKEVNAPDAGWVLERFMLAKMAADPRYQQAFARTRDEFSYPQPVVENKPESGYVMTRIKNYATPQLKTFDEAKAKIAAHLKTEGAIELAGKEAKKLQTEWTDGKNLPAIDTLDEVSGDYKHAHALIKRFFASPAAVGEVLPVASAAAEKSNPADKEENPHARFHIGFAVERLLPTLDTFERDTAYDRDQGRRKAGSAEYSYLSTAFDKYIYGKGEWDRTILMPRLSDTYRKRD